MMDPWFREQFTDAHESWSRTRPARDSISSRRATTTSTKTWPAGPGTTTRCSVGRGWSTRNCRRRRHRSPLLSYPVGTMLDSIYKTWRWPRVVDKVEHDPKNPLEYAKIWRIAQQAAAAAGKPVKFGTCSAQVLAFFLDSHTPHYDLDDKKQLIWDMAEAMNLRTAAACRLRLQGDPGRGADAPLHGPLLSGAEGVHRLPGRRLQPRNRGARRRRGLDPHLLGQPQHAEGVHGRVVRQLDGDLPRTTQGRRLDDRGHGKRLRESCRSSTPTRIGSRRRSPWAWSATARCRPTSPMSWPNGSAAAWSTSPPTSSSSRPTAGSAGRDSTATWRSTRRSPSPWPGTSCSRNWASNRGTCPAADEQLAWDQLPDHEPFTHLKPLR